MGLSGPVKSIRLELTKSGEAPAGMFTMQGYSLIEARFDKTGMKQSLLREQRYDSGDSWTDSTGSVFDASGACTEYYYSNISVYIDGRWTPDNVYGLAAVTKYDESGRRIETIRFTSDERLLYVWKTTYDSISNVADEIGYDSLGIITSPYFKYKYNLTANLIEEMKLTDDQRLTSRKTFHYDSEKNLVKTENFTQNSKTHTAHFCTKIIF